MQTVSVSAPGVIALFGEYGTLFGEPSVALAIDLRLELKVNASEFDFHVVDGFKLDPKKHDYFHRALTKHRDGPPLDLKTSSQLPMVTGLGTNTVLTVLLAGALSELIKKVKEEEKPELKNKIVSPGYIARHAYEMENSILPVSPLTATTAVAGGCTALEPNEVSKSKDELWSVSAMDQSQKWSARRLKIAPAVQDAQIILGYLKRGPKQKFTAANPKPLFDTPIKPTRPKPGTTAAHGPTDQPDTKLEPMHEKMQRFAIRTGFAKDIIKEIGTITRSGVKALLAGDIKKAGELLSQQNNQITTLGVCPDALRPLIAAAQQKSYGVSLTGASGDCVVALSDERGAVVEDIQNAGGEAVIVKMSRQGYKID